MSPGTRVWLLVAVLAVTTAPLLTIAEERCLRNAETGPCRGYFLRYFFNVETNDCEEFVYGGCRSNGNNFMTKEECQRICSNQVARSTPWWSWWKFW